MHLTIDKRDNILILAIIKNKTEQFLHLSLAFVTHFFTCIVFIFHRAIYSVYILYGRKTTKLLF